VSACCPEGARQPAEDVRRYLAVTRRQLLAQVKAFNDLCEGAGVPEAKVPVKERRAA